MPSRLARVVEILTSVRIVPVSTLSQGTNLPRGFRGSPPFFQINAGVVPEIRPGNFLPIHYSLSFNYSTLYMFEQLKAYTIIGKRLNISSRSLINKMSGKYSYIYCIAILR